MMYAVRASRQAIAAADALQMQVKYASSQADVAVTDMSANERW